MASASINSVAARLYVKSAPPAHQSASPPDAHNPAQAIADDVVSGVEQIEDIVGELDARE